MKRRRAYSVKIEQSSVENTESFLSYRKLVPSDEIFASGRINGYYFSFMFGQQSSDQLFIFILRFHSKNNSTLAPSIKTFFPENYFEFLNRL